MIEQNAQDGDIHEGEIEGRSVVRWQQAGGGRGEDNPEAQTRCNVTFAVAAFYVTFDSDPVRHICHRLGYSYEKLVKA